MVSSKFVFDRSYCTPRNSVSPRLKVYIIGDPFETFCFIFRKRLSRKRTIRDGKP